jgi:hypothetical protein
MTERETVVHNLVMLKGIEEGSVEHKMIINVFNKSKLCPRYDMTIKDNWCATAVSYAFIAAKLAGKPGSGAVCQFVECSCGQMIELAKKQGIWIEKDDYIPKKGDVIAYDWNDSGKGDNTGWPDHVGLVEFVKDDYIKVIEGNKNDYVGERNIKVNARYIRGFIAPKYKDELYYPKYFGKSNSIVDALKVIGINNPSFSLRGKIAKVNGIKLYIGSASQNLKLLDLLKKGKLKRP